MNNTREVSCPVVFFCNNRRSVESHMWRDPMSKARTRRDFLKLSVAGLAAGAATESLPVWAAVTSAKPGSGEITVRVTDEKRRFERAPALAWRPSSGLKPSANVISLNPQEKFKEILGF